MGNENARAIVAGPQVPLLIQKQGLVRTEMLMLGISGLARARAGGVGGEEDGGRSGANDDERSQNMENVMTRGRRRHRRGSAKLDSAQVRFQETVFLFRVFLQQLCLCWWLCWF